MKKVASTEEFLKFKEIINNSKEVDKVEKAKQEIIRIATKEIEYFILKYAENDLESSSILDKSTLSDMYFLDTNEFDKVFTTLHPIYDFKQDCILYLFQEIIHSYNPLKGAAFKTFVYKKIGGFMQSNFHNNYRTISLTSDLMKNYSRDIKMEKFKTLTDERKKKISEIKPLLLNPYDGDFDNKSKLLVIEESNFERIDELKRIFNKVLTRTEYKYLILSIDEELTNIDISKLEGKTPQYVSKVIINAKNKVKNSEELKRMWA